MKDFKARTEGLNDIALDDELIGRDGTVASTLYPGVFLIMNTDGLFELLGATTITKANKHLVYYCNSWSSSVTALGNGMVSAIPITKQFDYEITLEAGDLAEDITPGDLLCITAGDYAIADGIGDYVIGSVRSGTATALNGGTITVTTLGGDYAITA